MSGRARGSFRLVRCTNSGSSNVEMDEEDQLETRHREDQNKSKIGEERIYYEAEVMPGGATRRSDTVY